MNQNSNAGSYRVLARAYRPTKLSELIGQEALVRTLTNGITSGRLAHAYLLSGIRGIGKTTTARIIARALNCTGADGKGGPTPEPCGVCPSCTAIAEDRTVDVIEMDAASHTGKGDVLELMEGVHYAPAASRYKVYIFDEVHMLSEKAWNALLKTIEEPPPHVKFIFATTEIRKVPVTVLSRCQRFELRRVPAAELARHLSAIAEREGITVEPRALGLIAQSGEGSVRDALSLLDQAIALSEGPISAELIQDMLGLGDRNRLIDLYEAVAAGDAKSAIIQFGKLFNDGADPITVVNDLLELTHVLSRRRLGIETVSSFTATEEVVGRCRKLAADQSLEILARAWQMLLQGLEEVRAAPDAHDAAEMLLLRLASVSDLPPPGELARLFGRGDVELNEPVTPIPEPTLLHPETAPVSLETADGRLTGAGPVSAPMPNSLDDIISLLRSHGEQVMAARLYRSAHLLAIEPGRLELRIEDETPKDFFTKLQAALTRNLGETWIVSLGFDPGEATLAERDLALHRNTMERLSSDPNVRGLMEIFPGASLVDVRLANKLSHEQ